MEVWDAYKEDGSLAGCDLIRGEPIPAGLYHIVSEILVRHTDGSYLLMQRDLNKEGYPGMYEASAGGSILKGENPASGAIRELQEETGITANSLTPIYNTLSVDGNTIYHGFLYVTDCDKSSVTLQEGETISYIWLPENEFLSFIDTKEYIQAHKIRLSPYLDSLI